jgi:hypothetical protein
MDRVKMERLIDESDRVMQDYQSVFADYVFKLTLATVLFFATFPWAALFWPPFLYRRWDE